jgi:hypothetical protein
VSIQILRALLENAAGFYGAQMNAMDNATRNAGDMIDRYTLEYNRTRQAQITKELIEIISEGGLSQQYHGGDATARPGQPGQQARREADRMVVRVTGAVVDVASTAPCRRS